MARLSFPSLMAVLVAFSVAFTMAQAPAPSPSKSPLASPLSCSCAVANHYDSCICALSYEDSANECSVPNSGDLSIVAFPCFSEAPASPPASIAATPSEAPGPAENSVVLSRVGFARSLGAGVFTAVALLF